MNVKHHAGLLVLAALWWRAAGLAVQYGLVRPGSIKAPMLVLSAGSMSFQGVHPYNASITTPEGCSLACGLLPGCTGWTFCNRAQGCGSGCSSYVAKRPKITPGPPPTPNPLQVDLPVDMFGPWTFPSNENGCQYDFDSDKTSDAWPFGLCTLKAVPDTQQLDLTDKGDGWVSGTITLPSMCSGLSAAACQQCLAAARPEECIRCAKDKRALLPKPIQYLIKQGSQAQQGCAVCGNITDATTNTKQQQQQSSAQQAAVATERAASSVIEKCYDCVLDQKPCQTCVYGGNQWGPGEADVAACLRCAARKGDGYIGGCNACSQSKAPGRCFQCLDSFPFWYCAYGSSDTRSGCILPSDPTPCAACANGAKSDAAYWECLKCFRNPFQKEDCRSCTSVPSSAAGQLRCYQCASGYYDPNVPYLGCSQCFGRSIQQGKQDKCLACIESSSTIPVAKELCAFCVDKNPLHGSAASQDKCFKCLQTDQSDHAPVCLGEGYRRRRRMT